jgi:hypothetical protein
MCKASECQVADAQDICGLRQTNREKLKEEMPSFNSSRSPYAVNLPRFMVETLTDTNAPVAGNLTCLK